jgi:hypothetical protein
MIDTTFAVIKGSITALPMDVMKNVGIPVGFAFGWKESIEQYSYTYEILTDRFQIDLRQ